VGDNTRRREFSTVSAVSSSPVTGSYRYERRPGIVTLSDGDWIGVDPLTHIYKRPTEWLEKSTASPAAANTTIDRPTRLSNRLTVRTTIYIRIRLPDTGNTYRTEGVLVLGTQIRVMGVQEQYPFDVEAVRADFPILDRLVGGDPESPGEGVPATTRRSSISTARRPRKRRIRSSTRLWTTTAATTPTSTAGSIS